MLRRLVVYVDVIHPIASAAAFAADVGAAVKDVGHEGDVVDGKTQGLYP